jgi:hypothetical protein
LIHATKLRFVAAHFLKESARALGQAGATGVGRRVGMAHGRRGVVALLFLVACLSHAHEGHEHEENEVKFPPWGAVILVRDLGS